MEAAALLLGLVGQKLDAARANAPGGKVNDPEEGRVLVRIFHEPQVGQGMLDLGALKKPQAPKDAIRQAGLKEGLLDHAGLGVAAIEHGHLTAQQPLLNEAANLLDHPTGF